MQPLTDFLESLFDDGVVTFSDRPVTLPDDRRAARDVLNRVHAAQRLSVAGPPVAFDADAALAAAEFLRWACWFVVNRDEPEAEVERLLAIPPEPQTAAQHFSTDLTFRYLPQVHRRAKALNPDDVLTVCLEAALRRFPLSGVLADVADGPTTGLEFANHPGLQVLYAERYSQRPRAAWRPGGRTGEYVELVGAGPV
jgi:hypothetical protein